MFKSKELFNLIKKEGVDFVTGVPCSIFKDFLNCINANSVEIKHIAASSEGEAVGIASGYYLASGKIPLVYMQNSGLGNAINPLTSLSDKEVYSIPLVLFISWRGEPGVKDEPQHKKMGKITLDLLDVLRIPFEIASDDINNFGIQFKRTKEKALKDQVPAAIIFKKGIIEKEEGLKKYTVNFTREQALEILLNKIGDNPVIATTGKTSREIFEIREKNNQNHVSDFLTVGSMGCSSAIALGIALNLNRKVFIIDGDGAVLMKMGNMATIGNNNPKNLVHIVIDNAAYESTGGQPTSSPVIKWKELFFSLGYKEILVISNKQQLIDLNTDNISCPAAIIIKVDQGSRKDLGRPNLSPVEMKDNFIKFLKE